MKSIRVGNGCGFWGDNLDAPVLLAERGQLDYLTLEYLAELTMSILALQKQKHEDAGYARDFIDVLGRLAPLWRQQPGLRIITNAGGMNPLSCARQARAVLDAAGLTDRKIAIVAGDDLMPRLDELLAAGESLAHFDTGQPLHLARQEGTIGELVSANAYLGAAPIVEALRLGADLVVTGRVVDAALTLAPAVFELGWQWDDWQRLNAGVVAGHLIECGAQVTGGLWCNWRQAPDLANVGYPIAEIEESGVVRITKPEGSGGAVNFETVVEQLLYEVGDPAAYVTPDVIADFTTLQVAEVAKDVVEIRGGQGKPPPERYKVSAAYRAGFSASAMLTIFGEDAALKAEACAGIIADRLRRAGVQLNRFHHELLGANAVVPGVFPLPTGQMEVVLRMTVFDTDRYAVERFTKEVAPLVTSGPPGVTGYTGGRAPVREVLAYWPSTVVKSAVVPIVQLLES
ncbi:MAG: hypothetical protein KatS3mg105_4728 [Gemmatales bacterium]|nr:MAG: hypothetical protein KatS3mg105_4728 [Gemmatales bacterium]